MTELIGWVGEQREAGRLHRKLKVFPESNGAKGSVKFTAKGDANFDFAGQVAHTSDAGTADKVFLQCIADGSPLPFTVP